MLSVVKYITHLLSIIGYISICSQDQKLIVKYVQGPCNLEAFIFMYFPSDDHFPEFKFKIHSLTIKTMI